MVSLPEVVVRQLEAVNESAQHHTCAIAVVTGRVTGQPVLLHILEDRVRAQAKAKAAGGVGHSAVLTQLQLHRRAFHLSAQLELVALIGRFAFTLHFHFVVVAVELHLCGGCSTYHAGSE
jgi:hypothetical protein